MSNLSDEKRRNAVAKLDQAIANMRRYLLLQVGQEKIRPTLAIIEELKAIREQLQPSEPPTDEAANDQE